MDAAWTPVESIVVEPRGAPAGHVTAPTFTGCGAEYFRIWIVNLLFTLLTFGLYSAWAKVRKARYFRQNTRLDGHVFDYHGNPRAILRGRILAALLFGAYTWTFQFSDTAGIVMALVLCALGPWLLMRAQQFALVNTSYRGLRFGFRPRMRDAYRTLLPVITLWLAPTVATAHTRRDAWFVAAFALALPGMHHTLKRFQRSHATYGDSRFAFRGAVGRFYWVYAKGFGIVLAAMFVVTAALVGIFAWQRADPMAFRSSLAAWLYGALAGLCVYVAAGPYYAARLQQIVWSRTRLGDLRFHTEIRAWPLFRIVVKNVALTAATAGLYWPFAAIALARYRIECVRVESTVPLAKLAGAVQTGEVTATGEGAADLFGVDIGL